MPETESMTVGFARTTVLGRTDGRCESCERKQQEIHKLKARVNELTIQAARDRVIARSQPEGLEAHR